MPKLLLHVCCGPCATATLDWLRAEVTREITGLFYNPNIHPEAEYQRRRAGMEQVSQALELPLLISGEEDGLVAYLREIAFREAERCRVCYAMRLAQTAKQAAAENYEVFSTTLLISPYQNQEEINRIGKALSKLWGPDFLFQDLRPYYPASRQKAKALGLYQQKYCGCIFSEMERIERKSKSRELALSDPKGPVPSAVEGSRRVKSQRPETTFGNLPKSQARPFTLPGLDAEATAELFAGLKND
jgi:epoxyqueuosine reductase